MALSQSFKFNDGNFGDIEVRLNFLDPVDSNNLEGYMISSQSNNNNTFKSKVTGCYYDDNDKNCRCVGWAAKWLNSARKSTGIATWIGERILDGTENFQLKTFFIGITDQIQNPNATRDLYIINTHNFSTINNFDEEKIESKSITFDSHSPHSILSGKTWKRKQTQIDNNTNTIINITFTIFDFDETNDIDGTFEGEFEQEQTPLNGKTTIMYGIVTGQYTAIISNKQMNQLLIGFNVNYLNETGELTNQINSFTGKWPYINDQGKKNINQIGGMITSIGGINGFTIGNIYFDHENTSDDSVVVKSSPSPSPPPQQPIKTDSTNKPNDNNKSDTSSSKSNVSEPNVSKPIASWTKPKPKLSWDKPKPSWAQKPKPKPKPKLSWEKPKPNVNSSTTSVSKPSWAQKTKPKPKPKTVTPQPKTVTPQPKKSSISKSNWVPKAKTSIDKKPKSKPKKKYDTNRPSWVKKQSNDSDDDDDEEDDTDWL